MVEATSNPREAPFAPTILALCCNWCGYAGVDHAGIAREQYPAAVRLVKLNCIGRVRPELVLEAFGRGADGVLVIGCHVGDCHYVNGNETALSRLAKIPALLQALGIDPGRFAIDHLYAYDGVKFAGIVQAFTRKIQAIGPNTAVLA